MMARSRFVRDGVYSHTGGGCAHVEISEPGAPNLDSMSVNELMGFWHASYIGGWSLARFLFPYRPKDYVKVTGMLGGYASNKATAMRCRERGDINAALVYERIADGIYDKLPDYARW